MRPQSIIWFERLYLAAFVVGLISIFQTWDVQARMLANDPMAAGMPWLAWATLFARAVIAIALWYCVARLGSNIARWIVAALAVWGVGLLAVLGYGFGSGSAPMAVVAPAALQNILYVAAAAMLFRADARPWFGGDRAVEPAA
ncbi:hypothetical protein [Sphingomonas sp.]|uniref:hypothetical protein n=1 Tax=Sphingomonas sp. TaxID=28214 RepID=UPI002DD64FE7|nr:hypothetical protein [Sphingomonas sp.]